MKKGFILLLSSAFALSTMTAAGAVESYDGKAQLEAARADLANWMKYLPDDVFAAHVSMPGAHDAAMGHDPISFESSSKAQGKTIDEQLAAGVRAFDFRPGLRGSGDDQYLNCDHGISTSDLKFKDAMVKLTDYLKAHPSEFMALHLFKANLENNSDAAKRAKFDELINEIFNEGELADFFVDFYPSLKVKDMRGKIVVFRRDKMAYANIHKAGNLGGWPSDSELWVPGAAATATNASDLTVYGKIRVTDVSSPNNQEKLDNELNSITNLFTYNCNEERPNAAAAKGKYEPEWTMIFTSGEYKFSGYSGMKGYLQNATLTNPHLIDLINKAEVSGPTGMVFADWVLLDSYEYKDVEYATKGAELVTAVLENNFKYIGEFILDDNLFKDEPVTETDRFGGKEYYLRNVATGEFLSAGADWGTHAILDETGIRITPLFNKRTGEYLLKTTFKQNDVPNYLGNNCYIDNTAPNPVHFVPAETPNAYYITLDGVVDDVKTTVALTPERTGNTYSDGATMLIENRKLEPGNLSQQWELITGEDLMKELAAQASADNGVDMSFMLRGIKHRVNDGENDTAWTFTVENGSTCAKKEINGTNEWYDKEFVYRAYVGYHSAANVGKMHWTLSQTVTGLPDGKYALSMQALADNLPLDNEEIFSFTANGTDMRTGMATNATGKLTCKQAIEKFRDESLGNCLISNDGIIVKDGKLDIVIKKGVLEKSEYNAFFFDNVKLTYYGPDNSGIDQITTDTIGADTIVDVYNIAGVLVRNNVAFSEALNGLSRGIYLVRTPATTIKMVK